MLWAATGPPPLPPEGIWPVAATLDALLGPRRGLVLLNASGRFEKPAARRRRQEQHNCKEEEEEGSSSGKGRRLRGRAAAAVGHLEGMAGRAIARGYFSYSSRPSRVRRTMGQVCARW